MNYLIYLLIINLLSLSFINKKILSMISILFRYDLFLYEGIEIEKNKKINIIDIILVKIILIIYILFSIIIIFIYVIIYGKKYNLPLYKQYLILINNPLLLPNFECSWLSGLYLAYKDQDLFIDAQNKIYWNNIFIKNNVNTPEIVGIINQGIINNNIDNNDKYIIKPIVGGLGNDIKIYDKNNIPKTNNYIIQKRIFQKINGHFRIVTVYDKTKDEYSIFNVYLLHLFH
jgi:hypothetical protein